MSVSSPSANPALSAMQDIQLPTDIGWWPLAPGVWALLIIVALLLLLGIIWLAKLLHRRRKQHAAAKEAITLLTQLDVNDPQLAVTISAVLKRTAISYGQRKQVAGLTGDDWYQYLDQVLPANERGQFAQLLENRYRRPGAEVNGEQLLKLTRSWLHHAPHYYKVIAKQASPIIKEATC